MQRAQKPEFLEQSIGHAFSRSLPYRQFLRSGVFYGLFILHVLLSDFFPLISLSLFCLCPLFSISALVLFNVFKSCFCPASAFHMFCLLFLIFNFRGKLPPSPHPVHRFLLTYSFQDIPTPQAISSQKGWLKPVMLVLDINI